MKRYCKKADIYNIDMATAAVLKCLDKAKTRRRNDTVRLFARVASISRNDARMLLAWRGAEYERVVRLIASKLLESYRAGRLVFRTVRMKYVSDGSSKKLRAVAMVPIWQLMLDHIASAALADIFRRVGDNQYSGLPGRGAVGAVRKIRGWLHDETIKYIAHLDIAKCYESIDRERLMTWLRRRVKNDELLELVQRLIETCPTAGLGLGSYLSQNLATLYLSELYHDLTERACKVRKSKKRGEIRVRLVRRVLFYMDDIFLLGSSNKDIHKACQFTIEKAAALGLKIKPSWQVMRVKEDSGKGRILDAMGFKISRNIITVRRRVFIRAKRAILRARKRIREHERLSVRQARLLISYGGYFANSNSGYFSRKYKLSAVMEAAKNTISTYDKKQHASTI